MPRFFVNEKQIADGNVVIVGEDAHHIARSLRMAAGEEVTVCDSRGRVFRCKLTRFEGDARVSASVVEEMPTSGEAPERVTLYQALPKGDKFDTIIQKAVECGVAAIVPFESAFCIARAKPDAEAHKTERRNRIASEAAKQSGRCFLPPIAETVSFDEAVKAASSADLPLFCYEGEGTLPLTRVLLERKGSLGEHPAVSLMIGSEGGFSEAEARAAVDAGMIPVGLGPRILRTETASGFALGCLAGVFELI